MKELENQTTEKASPTHVEITEKWQKERELLFLVRQSNKKQIAIKGSASLFFASAQTPEYYLQYPGIEKDFVEIGKLHSASGRSEVAQSYLEQNCPSGEGESCHSREGGNPFL